jgi:hypothetical protein
MDFIIKTRNIKTPFSMEQLEPASISQYASSVIDFSSQYGREGGQAYVAANLSGGLSRYPAYGDFTECCVFVSLFKFVNYKFELILY